MAHKIPPIVSTVQKWHGVPWPEPPKPKCWQCGKEFDGPLLSHPFCSQKCEQDYNRTE